MAANGGGKGNNTGIPVNQANNDLLTAQLKVVKDISALYNEVNNLLDVQQKALQGILDLNKEICANICVSNFGKAADEIKSLGDSSKIAGMAVNGLSTQANSAGIAVNKAADALAKTNKQADTFAKKILDAAKNSNTLGKITSGLGNILSSVWSGLSGILSGAISFMSTLAEGLTKLTISLLMSPLTLINSMFQVAHNLANQGAEYLRAMEEVRKEFGMFTKGSSKETFEMARDFRTISKEIGLSSYKIFGDRAETLRAALETKKSLGEVGRAAQDAFGGKALASLEFFKRGLGLGEEELKNIVMSSLAAGKHVNEAITELTKLSNAIGDAIGESPKVIARAVGSAMKNLKAFGGASVKELVRSEGYLRKLGVSLEKVEGLMSTFETLDTASEASAKLAQSFGVTIDAFKLMQMNEPGQVVEELRKGFQRAGVDTSKFSRQQYALLEETLNVDAATLNLGLSINRQGMSYDALSKKAEEASKKQMNEKEALNSIADSIERLVHELDTGSSLFEAFVKGFSKGIIYAEGFRDVIRTLNMALRQAYRIGIEVGKVFIEAFPGIQDILQGLKGIFDPKTFGVFAQSFSKNLRDFFRGLSSGKESFATLWSKLKKSFFDYFNSAAPAGKQLIKGIRTFLKTISTIIAGVIKEAGNTIADLIKSYATGGLSSTVSEVEDSISFIFKDLYAPIFYALGDALSAIWDSIKLWALPKIKSSLTDLGIFIGDFIQNDLWNYMKMGWDMLGTKIQAVIIGFIGFKLIAGFVSLIMGIAGPILGLLQTITAAAGIGGTPAALPTMGAMMTTMLPIAGMILLGLAGLFAITAVIGSTMSMETIAKGLIILNGISLAAGIIFMSVGTLLAAVKYIGADMTSGVKVFGLIVGILGAFSVGVLALGGVIAYLAKAIEGISPIAITNAVLIVGSIALSFIALTTSLLPLAILSKILGANIKALGGFMLVAAISFGIIVGALSLILSLFSNFIQENKDISADKLNAGATIIKSLAEALVIIGKNFIIITGSGALGSINLGVSFLDKLFGGETTSPMAILTTLMDKAIDVMKKIVVMDFPEGSEKKVSSFVSIISAVSTLIGNVAQVTSGLKGTNITAEQQKVFSEQTKATENIVNTLFNEKYGIVGILNQIDSIIRDLSFSTDEKLIDKMSAFASIISAIGTLISGTNVAGDIFKDVVSKFEQGYLISNHGDIVNMLEGVKNGVIGVINSQRDLIKEIFSQITIIMKDDVLGNLNITPEKMNAFASILGNVGTVLGSLMNGLEAFRVEKITETGSIVGDPSYVASKELNKSFNEDARKNYTEFLTTLQQKIGPFLKDIFSSSFVDEMIRLSTLIPEDKISNLKYVSEILQSLVSIFKLLTPDEKILESLKKVTKYWETGAKYKDEDINVDGLKAYFDHLQNSILPVTTVLKEVMGKDVLGAFIENSKGADPTKIQALMPVLNGVIDFLKVANELVMPVTGVNKSIREYSSYAEGPFKSANDEMTTFFDKSSSLSKFFDVIKDQLGPSIKEIILKLIEIPIISQEQLSNIKNIHPILEAVSSIMNTVKNALPLLDTTPAQAIAAFVASKFSGKGQESPIKKAISAIQTVVEELLAKGDATNPSLLSTIKALAGTEYAHLDEGKGTTGSLIKNRFSTLAGLLESIKSIFLALKTINSLIGENPSQLYGNISKASGQALGESLLNAKEFIEEIYTKLNEKSAEGSKESNFGLMIRKIKGLSGINAIANSLSGIFTEKGKTAITNLANNIKTYSEGMNSINTHLMTYKNELEKIKKTLIDDNILSTIGILVGDLNTYFSSGIILPQFQIGTSKVDTAFGDKVSAISKASEDLAAKLNVLYSSYSQLTSLSSKFLADSIEGLRVSGDQKITAEIKSPNVNVNLKVDIVLGNGFVENLESNMIYRPDSISRQMFNGLYKNNSEAFDKDFTNDKFKAADKDVKTWLNVIKNNG